MFFQIYGETAGWQLLGWLLVFTGLVVMNEIARDRKQADRMFPGTPGSTFCVLYRDLYRSSIRCGMGTEQ